jgi:hypothetical protein
MHKGATRSTIHISAALAALWLTACGGGGGGDAAAPAPSAGAGTPAAAPGTAAPAPVASTTILVSADAQAAANQSYGVSAAGAGPVTLTLPPTAGRAVGDTVTVTGISATDWQVAQNAGQTILTGAANGNPALGGNVLPGTNWVASGMAPTQWHSVTTNPAGDVVLATDIPGNVHISTDGGATFGVSPDLPVGQAWIQADMSADGQRMVAIAFGGNMYLSTNKGANWAQVSGGAAVNLAGRDYESVTMSDDGQRIAAVIMNGPAVFSANGGATWAVGTSAGAALTKPWRSVDSSPDGLNLVAVSQAVTGTNGQVYTSADGGATWTLRPVTVGGAAVAESGWYRTRMSRIGNVIAIGANSVYAGGNGTSTMYISTDMGATWSASGATGGDFTGIAMNETGSVIGATSSNGTSGLVQYSSDGGATFQQLTLPSGTDTNFRQIAMDRFGDALTVVTGTFFSTPGQLYTSLGNRTSTGAAGGISGGGQGETLQLRYDGNGVFSVVGSTGAFTPR